MLIWISALFGLLNLLMTWLLARSMEGKPLSERAQRKVAHALYLMEQIQSQSRNMGIAPQKDPDEAASVEGDE